MLKVSDSLCVMSIWTNEGECRHNQYGNLSLRMSWHLEIFGQQLAIILIFHLHQQPSTTANAIGLRGLIDLRQPKRPYLQFIITWESDVGESQRQNQTILIWFGPSIWHHYEWTKSGAEFIAGNASQIYLSDVRIFSIFDFVEKIEKTDCLKQQIYQQQW